MSFDVQGSIAMQNNINLKLEKACQKQVNNQGPVVQN